MAPAGSGRRRPDPRYRPFTAADARFAARRRLVAMFVVCSLLLGAVAWRLVDLQVVDRDRFADLALAQRLDTVPLDPVRGSIFDRNGFDLALSIQRESVWANPELIADPAATARALAGVVGTDEATLTARLGRRDRQFVYVARAVDDDVAVAVRALGLDGVGFVQESRRHYPAEVLGAPVLGTVDIDNQGAAGLEQQYDELLAGRPGERVFERDRRGRTIPESVRHERAAQPGVDLVLTLDQALQYRVEQSLADQVHATGADGAMAVVLDLQRGDVLAMATVVTDDGSAVTDDGSAVTDDGSRGARPAGATDRNRPLTDVFEPGSTSKLVTVAAALEHGLVGPWTEFDVPPTIQVADATFHDFEWHPPQRWSVRDCVRESSNVCTIQIARELGAARLDAALRDFGLGERTSVDFPGQSAGLLLAPDEYYGTGLASVSIGYSVGVTAQQMLDAFATIANDGRTRPARLLAATIDAQGVRRDESIASGVQVVAPETAALVREMLVDVVSDGTGACAAVPGYTVGGKTGTSRKALESGGYSEDGVMASFIGFAPAERPTLAAIVVIDEPDASGSGGRVAAPVFAQVMRDALRTERIPPPGASDQFERARARSAALDVDCSVPRGAASLPGPVASLAAPLGE